MPTEPPRLRRPRTCQIRTTTSLDSPLCGAPAVGKRWGQRWACSGHIGFISPTR